jgi:anti-sigma factor RsiW
MNESDYMNLREAAWRRPLTAEEKAQLQSYLVIHPESQLEWEGDTALNLALSNLPNAPLSSNFTARVLQAIELEELRAHRRAPSWMHRMRLWLPRMAVASLVVGLGGLGYQQMRLHQIRDEQVKSLKLVSKVAVALPDMSMWQDFDAIARLEQTQPSANDQILWAALSAE